MNGEVRQELQRLLSGLCDGVLTDTQQTRLEELLAADADCRRHYLEYMDTHARLLQHPNLASAGGAVLVREAAPAVPGKRRRRVPPLLGYLWVAAATLAASLLVQFFWRPSPTTTLPNDNNPNQAAAQPNTSEYVATLSQTADCVWENANESRKAGCRLLPGEVRLRKGIAGIRFDSGADLVIEGPAQLHVDSGRSATVLSGKVVFRADDMAAPFDLHTPSSTLVDLGTEYAVAVGPEGEEIHVFNGEVRRTPKNAEPLKSEHLLAGEARHYGLEPNDPGQALVLDPVSFVRHVSDPRQPLPDPTAGLLAYEGFDYQDSEAFRAGKANGGFGWAGRWTASLTRPYPEGERTPFNQFVLNPKESLSRPGAAISPVGGCFDYIGFAKYYRRLSTPIRLDADGVYYLSFLFRRHSPSSDPVNAVAILLRTTEEVKKEHGEPQKRLNIGVGGPNQLFTQLGDSGSRTPLPLNYGETYLLVAKIAASGGNNPDQVFIRVYGPQEAVERDEPSSWTVVGPPFRSNLVFNWLEIHINSRARQTIDELRVGTTWSSATAPWLPEGDVKKQGPPR